MTAVRLLAARFREVLRSPWTGVVLIAALALGLTLQLYSCTGCMGPLSVLRAALTGVVGFGIAALFGGRRWLRVLIGVSALIWVVAVQLVILHYRVFGCVPTAHTYALASQVETAAASIRPLLGFDAALMVAAAFVVVAIYVVRSKLRPGRKQKWLFAGLLPLAVLLPIGLAFRDHQIRGLAPETETIVNKFEYVFYWDPTEGFERYGFWGGQFYYAGLAAAKGNHTPMPNPHPPVRSLPVRTSGHPNIIIIQVESLDAALINRRVEGVEVTPFLNQLSRNAFYCPHFFAVHGAGGTSDAELAALTGVMPPDWTAAMTTERFGHLPSLARRLKTAGYVCYAMHGNSRDYWDRGRAYLELGFDRFFGGEDFCGAAAGWESMDREFLQQCVEKLEPVFSAAPPVFAYLITQTMHGPFDLAPVENQQLAAMQMTSVVRDYYVSANYTDAAIREFVRALMERGVMKNTVLLIYGDHESHLRQGEYSTGFERKGERIPLFIVVPWERGRIIEWAGSHLDVGPTVADLAGLGTDERDCGRSLLRWVPDRLLPITAGNDKQCVGEQQMWPLGETIDPRYREVVEYSRSFYASVYPTESNANPLSRISCVAHALGQIDGRTYTNSRAAFDRGYRLGVRCFEVDLIFTADKQLICAHDARRLGLSSSRAAPLPEWAAMQNVRVDGRYPVMHVRELMGLVRQYPDVYVIPDVKADDVAAAYRQLQDEAAKAGVPLTERIIPQIYNFTDLVALDRVCRFPWVILTLYRTKSGDTEVLKYVSTEPRIAAVTVSKARFSPRLLGGLRRQRVPVFVHTVNSEAEIRRLRGFKVQGVYTDLLTADPLRQLSPPER